MFETAVCTEAYTWLCKPIVILTLALFLFLFFLTSLLPHPVCYCTSTLLIFCWYACHPFLTKLVVLPCFRGCWIFNFMHSTHSGSVSLLPISFLYVCCSLAAWGSIRGRVVAEVLCWRLPSSLQQPDVYGSVVAPRGNRPPKGCRSPCALATIDLLVVANVVEIVDGGVDNYYSLWQQLAPPLSPVAHDMFLPLSPWSAYQGTEGLQGHGGQWFCCGHHVCCCSMRCCSILCCAILCCAVLCYT